MPKISVIIPCFNHGKYIDEAIKSVLTQTFQDFEIIVVNDGSTDDFTVNILSNTNWLNTKVYHIANSGLSAARNYGITHSSGKIIVALDADDIFMPTFFEKGLAILDQNERVGFVSSYIETFGVKKELINHFLSGGIENFINNNNTIACAMFRKQCWIDAGGYDETMKKGYEDWEFWISITSLGWKVHIIPEVLFLYRKSKNSMLIESNKMRPELVKYIFEKHKDSLNNYIVDATYSREQQLFSMNNSFEKEREYYKSLILSIKESEAYLIGSILIFPFSIIKNFLSRIIRSINTFKFKV